MTRVFVYGTLKRGFSNHALLAGQRWIGDAITAPGHALFELEGYPGLVRCEGGADRVAGEVWDVDEHCLRALDDLEGVDEGLYRREQVALESPFDGDRVDAYFYLRSTDGRPRFEGSRVEWPQPSGSSEGVGGTDLKSGPGAARWVRRI